MFFRNSLFVTVVTLLALQTGRASTVAYYRFEEGTVNAPASSTPGSILDSSSNAFNANAINGPTYTSNVPSATVSQTGQANQKALTFNGTNQRVFITDSYQPLHFGHSMTLEASAFVQTTIAGNQAADIIFRGDDIAGYDPYRLTISSQSGSSSSLFFEIEQTDPINGLLTKTITMSVPNNQWIDIEATLDDATGAMDLYLNGVLQSTATTNLRPYNGLMGDYSPGIGLGGLNSGNVANEYFHGMLDEVRFSDAALTPAQFLRAVPEPSVLASILLLPASLTRRQRKQGFGD